MGLNFVIGCARCEKARWMLRGEESAGIHSFFREHMRCWYTDPMALRFCDDQITEQPWAQEHEPGAYALEMWPPEGKDG